MLAAALAVAPLAGQQLTRDIHSLAPGNPDSDPQRFVQVGADTYFTAHTSASGTELYRRDGATGAVAMVADLQPGAGSSTPRHLTSFAGRLYFTADDGVHGIELWTSDGTLGGTGMLADISLGRELLRRSVCQKSAGDDQVAPGVMLLAERDTGRLFMANGARSGCLRVFEDVDKNELKERASH